MKNPTHTFPFAPLPGIISTSTKTSCCKNLSCKNLSSKNLSSYEVYESVFGAEIHHFIQENAPKYFVSFEVCSSNFSKVLNFGKV